MGGISRRCFSAQGSRESAKRGGGGGEGSVTLSVCARSLHTSQMPPFAALLLLCALHRASSAGLRDEPIEAPVNQLLDGAGWRLTDNASLACSARVYVRAAPKRAFLSRQRCSLA